MTPAYGRFSQLASVTSADVEDEAKHEYLGVTKAKPVRIKDVSELPINLESHQELMGNIRRMHLQEGEKYNQIKLDWIDEIGSKKSDRWGGDTHLGK